jgi:hypothetical protein
MPFFEVPIAASAYTTRGEEPDTLKAIVVVQLLGSSPAQPPPTYTILISNEKNEPVFVASDKIALSGPLGSRAVSGVQLAPGQYRLRAAVVDSSGRPGSIDMPLGVALRQAGASELPLDRNYSARPPGS